METPPSITERLAIALERSGMSQSDLARRVRLTRGSVNGWLKGRAVNLRPPHLFAVADALNVEARWLATGEGPMERTALSPDQTTLIREYHTLDTKEREAVSLLVHQIAEHRGRYS